MGNSQARRENERAKQISAKIFAAVGVPGGDKSVGMLGGGTLGSPLSGGGGGGGASVKSAGKASSRGGKNRTGRWTWSSTERIKVHSRHRDPLALHPTQAPSRWFTAPVSRGHHARHARQLRRRRWDGRRR